MPRLLHVKACQPESGNQPAAIIDNQWLEPGRDNKKNERENRANRRHESEIARVPVIEISGSSLLR